MSDKQKRKSDSSPMNQVEACPICGNKVFDKIEIGYARYWTFKVHRTIFPNPVRQWRCNNCTYILTFATDKKK